MFHVDFLFNEVFCVMSFQLVFVLSQRIIRLRHQVFEWFPHQLLQFSHKGVVRVVSRCGCIKRRVHDFFSVIRHKTMPPRALKAVASVAAVEDDTTLYSGIKNLALSYFDTTSAYNKIAESSVYKTAKKHFDFQTVKGLDWQQAVGKIMGDKAVKDFGEEGKKMVKTAMKIGVGELAGEVTLGQTVISTLADLIIDSATDAFSRDKPVQEQFEEGTWIYIDRGKKQTKQHHNQEMVGETSMFFDSDDVLVTNTAREYYSPGFYINHVHGTNNHLVYSFDIEGPIAVNFHDVRGQKEV